MPSWLFPVLLSATGTALSLVAAYFIARSAARKWTAIGGEAAQTRLTKTLQENAEATEKALKRRDERITELRDEFEQCKQRLEELAGREAAWRRERRGVKQEISDLHAEVRALRGKGSA